MEENESLKEIKKALIHGIALLLVVSLVSGFVLYTSSYRRTQEYPQYVPAGVSVRRLDDDCIVFEPEIIRAGLIFYPDERVEHSAYSELLLRCSAEGILCVAVKMPFNIPSLKSEKAAEIKAMFPETDNWYIAGHGKGGIAAAKCVKNNLSDYKGLILLASYTKEYFYDTGIKVLTVYGSNDKILNMKKYENCSVNLPADAVKRVIEGGNHTQFGYYGSLPKDGKAGITAGEQIKETVTLISGFIGGE